MNACEGRRGHSLFLGPCTQVQGRGGHVHKDMASLMMCTRAAAWIDTSLSRSRPDHNHRNNNHKNNYLLLATCHLPLATYDLRLMPLPRPRLLLGSHLSDVVHTHRIVQPVILDQQALHPVVKTVVVVVCLKVEAALLNSLIATWAVWITGPCPTPRARDPGLHLPSSHDLTLNSSWQPVCRKKLCTAPRRHGIITHQPEDVPFGGFRPELSCYPPLSHGSSRFEIDDR